MRSGAWIVLVAVVAAACGAVKNEEKRQRNIGDDTADIASDTRTLGEASAAVNEVIRVQDDCEQARPLVPKAQAALDEAGKRVRTVAGRASLDSLRAQVRGLSQACN
jgi:hypothetical protein